MTFTHVGQGLIYKFVEVLRTWPLDRKRKRRLRMLKDGKGALGVRRHNKFEQRYSGIQGNRDYFGARNSASVNELAKLIDGLRV
ncbi:hypothetical protein EH31_10170 [Erythrobacter longus]|uniref:Uncharacterized protein n=1 Tax=Erythrobacter longus TaxID=1044 RepID=A0A074MAK7_ERYLO|nr:hypothetical protein EH31_10170 [Erythrobacter longus]